MDFVRQLDFSVVVDWELHFLLSQKDYNLGSVIFVVIFLFDQAWLDLPREPDLIGFAAVFGM